MKTADRIILAVLAVVLAAGLITTAAVHAHSLSALVADMERTSQTNLKATPLDVPIQAQPYDEGLSVRWGPTIDPGCTLTTTDETERRCVFIVGDAGLLGWRNHHNVREHLLTAHNPVRLPGIAPDSDTVIVVKRYHVHLKPGLAERPHEIVAHAHVCRTGPCADIPTLRAVIPTWPAHARGTITILPSGDGRFTIDDLPRNDLGESTGERIEVAHGDLQAGLSRGVGYAPRRYNRRAHQLNIYATTPVHVTAVARVGGELVLVVPVVQRAAP